MSTLPQQLLAQSILEKTRRKARAQAVLNRPASARWLAIVIALLTGSSVYLLAAAKFEAPVLVQVLLVVGFAGAVINGIELRATQRRLEAAITLLQLREDGDN